MRVQRVNTATVISLSDVVLTTGGSGPNFTVETADGPVLPFDGMSLLLRIDRTGPNAPTLSVNGSPRAPWLDANGSSIADGVLQVGSLQRAVYDADRGIWLNTQLGGPGSSGVSPDFTGPLSERVAYDDQPRGKTFLAVDDTPPGPTWTLYVKRSNSLADWSAGLPIKASPAQTTVESQAAAAQAAADRAAAAARAAEALAARDRSETGAATAVANSAVSTAARDAAVASRIAAQQAADIAAGAQPNQVVEYPSVAAATASTIPAAKLFVRVAGSQVAGDQGAALYRKVGSQPTHSLWFRSADLAYWELVEPSVRPQQAGGADDGATPNDAAWNSIKTVNRPFALPRVLQGPYLFDAPLLLAGASVDPAPGATLRAPKGADFSPTFRTTRSLKCGLRIGDGDTEDYVYEFTPDHNRPRREKVVWPGLASINRDRYEKIDPRTLRHVAVAAGQDGLSGTIPGSATDRDVVFPLNADNVIRASLLPVRGGQDLRWARSPGNYPGDFVGGIFVHTTAGYYFLYAGATGAATLLTKLAGQDATNYTGIGWPGLTTDHLFAPGFASWGVRIYNNRSFALLINGYKAFGPWPVQGEIIEAGPGFLGTKTINAGAGWPNRAYRTGEAGGALAGLLCLGDSLTEDIHGGWTHVMAEALDGFRGIRITNLVNYAKGGDAAFQQLATLQTRGIPAGTTHAAVMVGANDFAGEASTDDFTLGHVTQIIDILVTAGVRVLLMVPFGAYTRASAGGRGANVVRNQPPARTQMMIAALGASKGVKVLDMNDVTGPLIGEFAAHGRAEPLLRDNVHQSAFGYKVMGLAAADALADLMIEPMTPEVIDGALPVTTLAGVYGPLNGWTLDGTDGLTYQADRRGSGVWYTLNGQLKPGARDGAAVIYRLPPNMRPARNYTAVAFSDAANVTLQVMTDGTIIVRGKQASGTYVRLDGLSFPAQ